MTTVPFVDRRVPCRDCGGAVFVFTASEQARFAEQGWPDPVRCLEHRHAKRAAHPVNSDPLRMATTRRCAECDELFDVTPEEMTFLRDTFGPEAKHPRRCLACRRAIRGDRSLHRGR